MRLVAEEIRETTAQDDSELSRSHLRCRAELISEDVLLMGTDQPRNFFDYIFGSSTGG